MTNQKNLNALIERILKINPNDDENLAVLIVRSCDAPNGSSKTSNNIAVQSDVYRLVGEALQKNTISDETIESNISEFIEGLSMLDWATGDAGHYKYYQYANQIVDGVRFAFVQLKQMNKNTEIMQEQVKNIQTIQDKIYGEVIAVLGIFTAITFALFGGFSAIGAVANALKNPKGTLFGYELIGMGLLFLFIYLIIVVLFNGIFKITNRDEIRKYLSEGNKVSMKQFGYPLSTGFTWVIGAAVVFIVLVGIGFVIIPKFYK
ncbi:hypothetical protein HAU13_08030 [Weissella confusa]|uniref:hypothetical protein n=1 Tax=Weissella confusa TaxID=1583 RepID=UPI0018F1EE4D|nr:hypothetical protein [Weissella confusa]MBJ7622690.1 hypothetical protein [Weissella confusa]